MSRIRMDIESNDIGQLLASIRAALRQYGGLPELRSDGGPLGTWTLTDGPVAVSPDACECCGCTEDSACEGGCSWDPTALAKGRLICSRCMSRVTTGPVHVRETKDGALLSRTVEMSTSSGAGSAGDGRPPAPVQAKSDEAIRSLLEEGKSVPEVARIVGLSAAAIYARRKKLGITPPSKRAKRGTKKASFRCQECGRPGQDPVRCEHCFERR